jgi:hypothetical protein
LSTVFFYLYTLQVAETLKQVAEKRMTLHKVNIFLYTVSYFDDTVMVTCFLLHCSLRGLHALSTPMLNAETVPAQEGEDLRRDVHRHDDGCRYAMPPGQALFFFLTFIT